MRWEAARVSLHRSAAWLTLPRGGVQGPPEGAAPVGVEHSLLPFLVGPIHANRPPSRARVYNGRVMSSKPLTVRIPNSLAEELRSASQEFLSDLLERGLREIKIERALERYSNGGISFAATARLAGVSRDHLARRAYASGIEPPFSGELLAEELRREL